MKRERRFATGQRHPAGGHYSPGMHRASFHIRLRADASRAAIAAAPVS